MADQTIAIRLILRDEMSRPLADIQRQIDRLSTARLGGSTTQMNAFGGAVRVVHRELSTLSRLTLGGLIGGGVIASIVGVTKALGDMAREGLQLRYQAEALRVTPAFFERMTDGLTALGEDAGQAKSSVTNLINALRDAEVQGTESSLFKRLEKGVRGTGLVLWRQIREQLRGPEGAEGAFKFLIERMRDMHPTGQRALMQQLGLSSIALKDLNEVLPHLAKRIQLPREEMLRLSIANTNFGIHMGNIGRQLGSAVMPGLEKITSALNKYLQTESGKKFTAELRKWADDVAAAVAKWIAGGGIDRAVAELKKAITQIEEAFATADPVVQGIGGWKVVIGALIALPFAAWLAAVAGALLKLVPLVPIMVALKDIMPLLGKSPEEIQALIEEQKKTPAYKLLEKEGLIGGLLKNFQDWWRSINPQLQQPQPQPQSGEGRPQTEQERRADLQEEKNQRELLKNEFAQLSTELGQLNSYFQVGGPEGTADGTSGFGAGVSGEDSAPPEPLAARQRQRDDVGARTPSFKMPPIPPGMFASRARMERWGKLNSFLRGQREVGLDALSRSGFAEWENAPAPPGYGPGGNLPRPGVIEREITGQQGRYTDWDFPGYHKEAPFRMHRAGAGGGSGAGGGGRLGGGGGGGGTNWNIPQLSPTIAPSYQGPEMQPLGGGGIIAHLARESAGARLTGSATVDIDVGGLGAPARNPDDLFRPQPLTGAVQMQNATHATHNPLSFQ